MSEKLELLIARYLDGSASSAEVEELDGLLRSAPDARKALLLMSDLEIALHGEATTSASICCAGEQLSREESSHIRPLCSPRMRSHRRRRVGESLAARILLVISTAAASLLFYYAALPSAPQYDSGAGAELQEFAVADQMTAEPVVKLQKPATRDDVETEKAPETLQNPVIAAFPDEPEAFTHHDASTGFEGPQEVSGIPAAEPDTEALQSELALVSGIVDEADSDRYRRFARIDRVEGIVEAGKDGSWRRMYGDHAVMPGDTVSTRTSRARVLLENGSVVYINRNSMVAFHDDMPPKLVLASGEVFVEVASDDVGFVVETAHGRVTDLGTRFGVRSRPYETTVYVAQGKVEAATDAGRVELDKNHEVRLVGKASAPGRVGIVRDLTRRMAWRDGLAPYRTLLAEDFSDPRHMLESWSPIQGGLPMSLANGRLEIDVSPQPPKAYTSDTWHVPGGLRTKAMFGFPIRVSATLASTHLHPNVVVGIVFEPELPEGEKVYVLLRGVGKGLIEVKGSRQGVLARSNIDLPWPDSLPVSVEVEDGWIEVKAAGQSVLRCELKRPLTGRYRLSLEGNAKADAPEGAHIRIETLIVVAPVAK